MIPVISPVTNFQNIQYGGNSLKPHILGCYPPNSMKHLVPVSVSLVETECPKRKASNNIKVYFDKNENSHKKGIAVCSKSLSHPGDVSMRIIEWIEVLRAQGVDKIILSVLSVHPNVNKVRLVFGGSYLTSKCPQSLLVKLEDPSFFISRYLNTIKPLVYLRLEKPL